jgi:fimbrial chaperone protein
MNRRTLIISAAGLLVGSRHAFAQRSAQGQDVQISPTMLTLASVGDTTICTIFNNGTAPTSSQIRIKSWSQQAGQDVLTDTSDIVVSPPFMTVQPNQQQVVRVANLSATAGSTELSYRLLLNQLPSVGSLTGGGIQMLLAFSVPLFVSGTDAAPAQLDAQFLHGPGGIILRLRNSGDIHARLIDLIYQTRNGRVVMEIPGLAGYVLARSTKDIETRLTSLPPPGGRFTTRRDGTLQPVPISLLSDE